MMVIFNSLFINIFALALSMMISNNFDLTIKSCIDRYFNHGMEDPGQWLNRLPQEKYFSLNEKQFFLRNANGRLVKPYNATFYGLEVRDMFCLYSSKGNKSIDALYILFEPSDSIVNKIENEIGPYIVAGGGGIGSISSAHQNFSNVGWLHNDLDITLSKKTIFVDNEFVKTADYYYVSIVRLGSSTF